MPAKLDATNPLDRKLMDEAAGAINRRDVAQKQYDEEASDYLDFLNSWRGSIAKRFYLDAERYVSQQAERPLPPENRDIRRRSWRQFFGPTCSRMLKCTPAAQRGTQAHFHSQPLQNVCIRNRCMQFRDPRTRWQFLPGRRLLFEELERRDLLAVMRIVDWNTLNGPNDAAGDANFRTVLRSHRQRNGAGQHPANRHPRLAGNRSARRRRLDRPHPGRSQLRCTQPPATASSASPVDGGGDSTGFVYDTSTVSLLESVEIGAGTLTHNVMRGKFQPVGSPASSIFYVYSVHLKSGTTGSDETLRGSEAAFLRADADALGEGTQVLMVGDFNMHTSDEAAWTNIVVGGQLASCKMLPTRPAIGPTTRRSRASIRKTRERRWMTVSTSSSPPANSSMAAASTTSATRFTSLATTERTRSTSQSLPAPAPARRAQRARRGQRPSAGRCRLRDSCLNAKRANQRNARRHQGGRRRLVRHVPARAQYGADGECRRHRDAQFASRCRQRRRRVAGNSRLRRQTP